MTSLYKKYFQKLQENLFSSSSFYRLLLLSHNDGFARLAKISEVSLHGMWQLLPRHGGLHYGW